MPRRTPIRELQKEETVPSSPLRRSSRISNNSPVPTKVVSRRNSATETSAATPKATGSRRSSLSQDQGSESTELEVDKKAAKTPRTRRVSSSSINEESANTEETVTKSKRGATPDPKRPVTRRRSTSQDPEANEEPAKKITRSRSSSANKNGENAEDAKLKKKKPSENGHAEVDEEIDQPEVVESKSSTSKKKKTDTLKVDLDLSVIKESSFVEDEETSTASADKEVEEIEDAKHIAKDKAEKTSAPVENAQKKNSSAEEKSVSIEDTKDNTREKAVVEDNQADVKATSVDKKAEEIQDVKLTTKDEEEKTGAPVDNDQEKKSTAEEENVATKNMKDNIREKAVVENSEAEEKNSHTTKKLESAEDTDDTMKERPVVEGGQIEEKTSEPAAVIEEKRLATKKTEESEVTDEVTKEEPVAENGEDQGKKSESTSTIKEKKEDSNNLKEDTTREKLVVEDGQVEEKKSESASCAPIIEDTEDIKEKSESNIEKRKSELASSIEEKTPPAGKARPEIEEKSESSILKENSSAKEFSDASFSDTSFHLQLSTSVVDDLNKTEVDGNLSPTSNKENVRPQQKSQEPEPEPMDVDESLSEIPSPSKTSRKSLNVTKEVLKLDDVEKKLEIAEKVTDEIAQFLTEEITHTSDSLQCKKIVVPEIIVTVSETEEAAVEHEEPNKEVEEKLSKSVKEPNITEQTEENAVEKRVLETSVEKEPSDATPVESKKDERAPENEEIRKEDKSVEVTETVSNSLNDSNISLVRDGEDANSTKIEENLLNEGVGSENQEPSEETALKNKTENEDSVVKDEAMENSQAVENLSISLNESANTTVDLQEKAVEQCTLEKSSVETEDTKHVESAENQKEVVKSQITETPINPVAMEEESANETEIVPESSPVASENAIQKEEAEKSPEKENESEETSVREKDASVVEDLKPNEETSFAEPRESDVEKKEEDIEDEIVVHDEGLATKEDDDNSSQPDASTARPGNEEVTASSPVLNKNECTISALEDNEESPFATKTVHEETLNEPTSVKSRRVLLERAEIEIKRLGSPPPQEVVILSDDEKTPDEENEVTVASDGEEDVEFVREDFDPTIVKVSPRDENEANVRESLGCEKATSLNSSKSWVDKTTFVMQETIRAKEDKESNLRERIHKVVDLFCSEIKQKGDISINVSLECTGQNSDVSDHETSIKRDVIVAVEPDLAEEQTVEQEPTHKVFSESTPEENTQPKEKQKKRKLNKKSVEETVEGSQPQDTTSTDTDQKKKFPKKKNKKQKAVSAAEPHDEDEKSPKKKSKKQNDEEEVPPTKKAKKSKEHAKMNEEVQDKQEKNEKNKKHAASKTKNKRHVDQGVLEEEKEIAPNRNENVIETVSSEEEAYSSPFAVYFSTPFTIDDSEDENDVTYQPSRELDASDSEVITDESHVCETSEDLGKEIEESLSYVKTDKKSKKRNERLLRSSDNEDGYLSSGSEDVFMNEEPTRKKNKKRKEKSKQKKKVESSEVSDGGVLERSPEKGRKMKQSNSSTTAEVSLSNGKKHKRKHATYTVSDEDVVPERKIKKEKVSSSTAEKANSPGNTKKVPKVKTKLDKHIITKSNKKNNKLKPSTSAAPGWNVKTV